MPPQEVSYILVGAVQASWFGYSLAIALLPGPRQELLVGEPYYSTAMTGHGRVYGFDGTKRNATFTLTGDIAYDRVGLSIEVGTFDATTE